MTTCVSADSNNCISSQVDVDARFTRTVAVLNAAGIELNPVSDVALPRAVLVIPSPSSASINNSVLFRLALSQSSGRYPSDIYYGSNASTPVSMTYVTLTEEELKMILPYVSQKGISAEPLMNLVMESQSGNLLVQAQYVDEVTAIIAAKERLTSQDLYSVFNVLATK